MKFSDMMGKGAKTADTADTAAPPALVKAPPVPEAPVRFMAAPAPVEDAPVEPVAEAAVETVVAPEPVAPPAIRDVMAELAPRRDAASLHQLDASAWLDGLTAIDDDLLPS